MNIMLKKDWSAKHKQKRTNKLKTLVSPFLAIGTLGANRTRDTRIRNPVLYPLSYEGMGCWSMWRNNT